MAQPGSRPRLVQQVSQPEPDAAEAQPANALNEAPGPAQNEDGPNIRTDRNQDIEDPLQRVIEQIRRQE